MPRNGSGTYSLPSGNPVSAGTLIDATWANNTLNDLANEMTDSLSRSGEGGMLAPFRLSDGVQATPGLAWSNEPSTGFYRAGTNEMWAVVGGTQIQQFTATGSMVRFAAGAVGTPSVTVHGDTNTGIYFPAADKVAVTTGGVQRIIVDDSGNVGVGTSSPGVKLDVLDGTANGNVGTPIARIVGANQSITGETGTLSLQSNSDMAVDTGGSIIFGGRGTTASTNSVSYGHIAGRKENGTSGNFAGYLQFGTSDSASDIVERMRLDSSGNLGIGTSSPAARLDVTGTFNGTQAVFGNTAGRGLLIGTALSSGTNEATSVLNARGAGAGAFLFQTDGTDRLTLDNNGNLGLGVTPSAWSSAFGPVIQVKTGDGGGALTGSSTDNFRMFANTFYDGAYKRIGAGYATQYEQASGKHVWYTAGTSTASSSISFTQAMTLDSSGNLLVGNTSNYGIGAAESNYIEVKSGVVFAANNTGSASNRNWVISPNGSAAGNLDFTISSANNNWPNAAYAMSLTSGGNLGLGVTPSAWGSLKAIQIGNGATFAGHGSFYDAYVYSNAYYDGSSWRYINSGVAASGFDVRGSDGKFVWLQAPSGTAGNTISFTQAMTLDASGNLAVGTTSPDAFGASYKTITLQGGGTSVGGVYIARTSDSSINMYSGVGASAGFVRVSTAHPLTFWTSDTERARITAGGSLLVARTTQIQNEIFGAEFTGNNDGGYFVNGSASPTGNGCVVNFTNATGTNANTVNCFRARTAGADRFLVYGNGGIANYQSNDVNLSDERTKTDIKPVGSYWDKFKAIEIVTFKYKDQTHDDDNIGVIAQQVESVAPEFVDTDGFGDTPEDGVPLKTIYTTDMYHAAIKALQEAMLRIEQLEAKVAALEGA